MHQETENQIKVMFDYKMVVFQNILKSVDKPMVQFGLNLNEMLSNMKRQVKNTLAAWYTHTGTV